MILYFSLVIFHNSGARLKQFKMSINEAYLKILSEGECGPISMPMISRFAWSYHCSYDWTLNCRIGSLSWDSDDLTELKASPAICVQAHLVRTVTSGSRKVPRISTTTENLRFSTWTTETGSVWVVCSLYRLKNQNQKHKANNRYAPT